MEIAVDLDGTLAYYDEWRGIEHIGEPIIPTLLKVQVLVKNGVKVTIFTARANDPEAIPYIVKWLSVHGLSGLDITCTKRKSFKEIWDDRAIRFERNTGKVSDQHLFHTRPYTSIKVEPEHIPLFKASEEQVGGGHYKVMKIQPMEFCRANGMLGMESSVVKYVSRHKNKNGAEDIKKAIHCLQLILEMDYDS
jgi:hypothetical protein